mmetsp:Transcript_21296/g.36551  ORF Transcript_21296/g.36551 Transcript_21296/m.36551 type:complete len:135 (+) Transcript_21296:122-526(+)
MTQPPHSLEVLGHPSPKSTLVRISISEGKNRQVRRMFHAINSGVIRLHRRKVGNVSLEMMQQDKEFEGKWRLLTDKEIFDGLGWKVRQLESSGTYSTKQFKGTSRRKFNTKSRLPNSFDYSDTQRFTGRRKRRG